MFLEAENLNNQLRVIWHALPDPLLISQLMIKLPRDVFGTLVTIFDDVADLTSYENFKARVDTCWTKHRTEKEISKSMPESETYDSSKALAVEFKV